MSKNTKIASREKINLSIEDGYDTLTELALDLRWSWDNTTDKIWHHLDHELWNHTHNPWIVLQTVSKDKFKKVMSDPDFRKKIEDYRKSKEQIINKPAWFQQNYPETPLTGIAYFSMEFMLSEALPIYSGGLGNVAGDQLKAASDLGVPIIGIGLLYQQGYFRQAIDKHGEQQALYPYNDPGQLPITPLRHPNGEWLRLEIKLPGHSIWIRTWQVQIGRVKLYLLDSNDVANFPIHRGITSELYGGNSELRLKQEMVLGIGGWRLLKALDINPQVCHLNEGHAAFAILERAYSYMKETGHSFEVALAITRSGNLFTTHTAVSAGFDSFSPSLMRQYLGNYAENKLNISLHDLLALGRKNPDDETENFNMAFLAIHGSGTVNGVSRLHGKVSRKLFEPVFLNWATAEIPVCSITNGVHVPTWDSVDSENLWTEACGKDKWLGTNKTLEHDIRLVSDEKLWELRTKANKALVEFASEYFSRQLLSSGRSLEAVEIARHLFDPDKLTLGFARRFATYKRPNLLLHDPERLLRILTNPKFPVQLILAGKAHPNDIEGQNLIKEWMKLIRQKGIHPPIIFLADYNMHVSENLVQGVDVWINTPRRPWEASGTSGMKILVNGGLNLSELDGWWAEAYTPEVGWALGDGNEHGDEPFYDAMEAEQLYNILENQVVPEFYNRNEKGIPTAWVSRMRESMAQLTPQFSADRTVREYTEKIYINSAKLFLKRSENKGREGIEIVEWKKNLIQNWNSMKFDAVKIETIEKQYLFEVQIYFNDINPDCVQVELFANGIDGETPIIQKMVRGAKIENHENGYNYHISVTSLRSASDYTPRIIPYFPDVSVPLEISLILWKR